MKLDDLKQQLTGVLAMLNDPEPGLSSWHLALHGRMHVLVADWNKGAPASAAQLAALRELEDAEIAAATGEPNHSGFDSNCAACRCLLHVRRAVGLLKAQASP